MNSGEDSTVSVNGSNHSILSNLLLLVDSFSDSNVEFSITFLKSLVPFMMRILGEV